MIDDYERVYAALVGQRRTPSTDETEPIPVMAERRTRSRQVDGVGRSAQAVENGIGIGSMAIRIGTSGFIYEHWRRRFYPPSARGSELELYAQRFDTVELNVTFYRMPPSFDVPVMGGAGPGGLSLRGEGQSLPDPRPSAQGAATVGRPAGGACERARTPPRPDPHPAAARPGAGPAPPSRRPSTRFRQASGSPSSRATVRGSSRRSARALTDRNVACAWPTDADRSPRCGARPIGATCGSTQGERRPRSCYGAGELERWAERLETKAGARRHRLRLLQQRRQWLRPARRKCLRTRPRSARGSRSPACRSSRTRSSGIRGLFVAGPGGPRSGRVGAAWGSRSTADRVSRRPNDPQEGVRRDADPAEPGPRQGAVAGTPSAVPLERGDRHPLRGPPAPARHDDGQRIRRASHPTTASKASPALRTSWRSTSRSTASGPRRRPSGSSSSSSATTSPPASC